MYPGYAGEPYRSPIYVSGVLPLGWRQFQLDFINIFYAAGVRHMVKRMRTLRRAETFILAEEADNALERVVILERLTPVWLRRAAPQCEEMMDRLFDDAVPNAAEFRRLGC